jgi:hypothetical protein
VNERAGVQPAWRNAMRRRFGIPISVASIVLIAISAQNVAAESPISASLRPSSISQPVSRSTALEFVAPDGPFYARYWAEGEALLLQASGSGNSDTPTFRNPSGAIRICWVVSGRSPSGSLGASAGFWVYPSSGPPSIARADVETSGSDCAYGSGDPGTYYVKVIATPWTSWSITVTSA